MLTLLTLALGIVGVLLLAHAPWVGIGLIALAYFANKMSSARDEQRFIAWLMILGGAGAAFQIASGVWTEITARL